MPRRTRLGELAVLLGLAGLLAWLFWPEPVAVEVVELARGPVVNMVRGEGQVRLKDLYVVAAPVAGRLERIARKPGDAVLAGEAVARIVPALPAPLPERSRRAVTAALRAAEADAQAASAALSAAEARLSFTAHHLKRLHRLAQDGVAAPAAVDLAAADFASAQAEIGAAVAHRRAAGSRADWWRDALASPDPGLRPPGSLDLLAPASGRILRVVQESETVVVPGQPLLLMGDPSAVEVELPLPSDQAAGLRPGLPVRLERWGGPALPGHISRIEPAGRRRLSLFGFEERWVPVIVAPDGPHEQLRPGWRVDLAIERDRREGIQVPVGAWVRRGSAWTAYVVDGGMVRQRPLSELAAGMQVVVFPGERVADGVRVRVRN